MDVNFANASIDLTPLIPLRFSMVTVDLEDMSAANLEPLTQIDPSHISQVNLIGETDTNPYQTNSQGMTNAQLAMLGPWLTKIDNNDVTRNGFPKYFDFSENSLTDFSPLKGFTKPATVAAGGEGITVVPAVNLVIGQPASFKAIPIIGVQGEDLTSHYETTWNGADTSTAAAIETPLKALGNGEFEIPTAYPTTSGANWFSYGFVGVQNTHGNTNDYINLTYPDQVQFIYDSMVYQGANWQTKPSVTATFVDQATGQPVEPEVSETSPKIGDSFDFSSQTDLPGYELLPGFSSATTGTYSQNPQYLEYRFEKEAVVAGGITINYVDPDGEPIVPPEQIKGDVGDSYTATPATIGNYVCKAVSPDSVATTGTLALAKGTITYQYDPVTVTRVINYVDAIANKNIGSTTLTVPYKGTVPDPTVAAIADYAAKGYQLVSNGYPADGSAFSSAALVRDYRVLFTHEIVTLNPGDTLPAGVVLTHNVTQTINFNYADGQTAAPSVTRRLMFTRRAVQDAVTGETQLTTWQPTGASSFAAYSVPVIENYQPDVAQVPSTVVTGESSNLLRTVTYTPKAGAVTVEYYLARTAKALKPSVELTGTVATPYDVTAPTIAGYHLVTDESASATGDYSDPAATVDFYYEPDAATTGSTSQPGVTTVTATPVSHRLGWTVSSPSHGSLARTASATTPTPVRTQIQLAPPVHHRLSPVTQPTAKVTTGTLPQTSEQRPTNIWGILALTMIGLVGAIRLRRER